MVVPSAPERISIKRRRIDEPIDHLLYQSKKQRTADHIFVRLPLPWSGQSAQGQVTEQPAAEPVTVPGIPTVRSTQPGDELNDFKKYRADHVKQQDVEQSPEPSQSGHQRSGSVRRFHLTRDLSTFIRPEGLVTSQTAKPGIRPHLPTFVERRDAALAPVTDEVLYTQPPIDRIVQHHESRDLQSAVDQSPAIDKTLQRQQVSTFKQSTTGYNDDDDLADELAALAMELDQELDPEVKAAFLGEQQTERQKRHAAAASVTQDTDREMEDYVFETYVRVKPDAGPATLFDSQGQSFGYLIIDDEHEELWQQYLNDEDDSDDAWDEEDEDSNAEENPRNDYPDEEVSSDDEFGYNPYKYRRYCSDDEQYDDDD